MSERRVVRLALSFLIVVATSRPGLAQSQAGEQSAQQVREDLDRLRKEFDEIRQQYGSRLSDLEKRLEALESARQEAAAPTQAAPEAAAAQPPAPEAAQPAPAAPASQAAQPEPATAQVPAGAAGAGGPGGTLPVYGSAVPSSKVFNPDIAVIGNFLGSLGTNQVEPQPTLQLSEAEASFQAVVDPYARADFFLGFGAEGVSVEEGFITFSALPGGLLLKVGQMYEAFGKVNTMHSHALPWTDRPLVSRNLAGGDENISDGGISVSKLILNPLFFLEATGEIYRGDSSVFSAPTRSDFTYVGRLRGYRDVTEASNLDIGTSVAYGHNDAGDDTTTRLIGVDAAFRWRPLRRATYQRFIARSELVWSRREQPGGTASAFGLYGSAEYQLARRWFGGLRYDYSGRAADGSLHDQGGSVLLTFWPSEFSQIRGQYRRTRYADGPTANEFLFQFLFSIGAHGAHAF
jgi:hypothetical protein